MDESQKAKQALTALANGDTTKAKDVFHELIQANTANKNKQNAEAWVHIGVLASLDDTNEAKDAFEQALALDPNNKDAKKYLDRLNTNTGDTQ